MKIAINAISTSGEKTGIGCYALDLIKATHGHCQNHDFLYVTNPQGIKQHLPDSAEIEELHVDAPSLLWEQLHLQDELHLHQVDYYHSPLFTCPIVQDIPSIITIHDVIPETHPDLCSEQFMQFYQLNIGPSIRACNLIITTSNYSRDELVKHFEISPDKISVVYQAISSDFTPGQQKRIGEIQNKYELPEKYILYVGMIEPRKNVERLIQAFGAIAQNIPETHLVLAGRTDDLNYDISSIIAETSCANCIHQLGYVDEYDLPVLYARAQVFAFPSLAEGFGRPVIEAMASGVPVICSNLSSLPEVVQDAAILFDPMNVDEISNAIEKAVKDKGTRKKLWDLGMMRSMDFTHEKFAEQLTVCYDRLEEQQCG